MNVKAEFLKVTPAGFVMARQRSAQQQAWEPGRVEEGDDSPGGPESAAQQGAEVGHCEEMEEAGLAKERLGGHIESQLLTMWHGCANNIRQAKLPCKKKSKTE